MSTALEESAWRLLDTVQDPCSVRMGKPLGLVGMGLVESITVEETVIRISLVLTGPGCVFYFRFADEITRLLEPLAEGREVDIAINDAVMWTADRMKPAPLRRMDAEKAGRIQ
jgi:metal-sulfur cluster biosynthetic enzyme